MLKHIARNRTFRRHETKRAIACARLVSVSSRRNARLDADVRTTPLPTKLWSESLQRPYRTLTSQTLPKPLPTATKSSSNLYRPHAYQIPTKSLPNWPNHYQILIKSLPNPYHQVPTLWIIIVKALLVPRPILTKPYRTNADVKGKHSVNIW